MAIHLVDVLLSGNRVVVCSFGHCRIEGNPILCPILCRKHGQLLLWLLSQVPFRQFEPQLKDCQSGAGRFYFSVYRGCGKHEYWPSCTCSTICILAPGLDNHGRWVVFPWRNEEIDRLLVEKGLGTQSQTCSSCWMEWPARPRRWMNWSSSYLSSCW